MRVAVVGLGRMGTAIAERLLSADHSVAVHNRTPGRAEALISKGAVEVSREDVWEHADVVVTMLSDSAALEDAMLGDGGLAIAGGGRGKILVDMSTVSEASSARVAQAAEAGGIGFLRAPISGNPGALRGGLAAVVASGPRDAFAGCEDMLRDIGPTVFHLGEGDEARIMKLALNLMVGGTAQLLAEAIAFGESHGLDRAAMMEVINGSAMASPFARYKTAALVADDYATTFSARLMRKDLDMALASAAGQGVPLPVTATVAQLLQGCISTGLGDLDFMALLPRLRREAGLPTGLPGADRG